MRIGFALPQFGAIAHQTDQIPRFAREIEALGADSLWVGDRLLAPVDPTVGYGGGTEIPERFHAVLDPFVLLTIAATVTERVELGTNILNAPWYPPALLARSLTSIDRLSAGRLVLGFGTGWSPEEYQAADVPMAERGPRLDEGLEALEALWTSNPAEYHGTHWSVPATYAELKPAQQPRPPIYLAGFAPPAMRRVARRAEGWLPVCQPGAGEFDPDAYVNQPLAGIRKMAEQYGRDPSDIDAILRVYPTENATVQDCADAVTKAEQNTDVDQAFVDFQCLAENVDQALDLAARVLERART